MQGPSLSHRNKQIAACHSSQPDRMILASVDHLEIAQEHSQRDIPIDPNGLSHRALALLPNRSQLEDTSLLHGKIPLVSSLN